MENDRVFKRWSLVLGEIQYRWPSLPIAELSSAEMPNQLQFLLARHYGLSSGRAASEADRFWNDFNQRLEKAVA